VKIEDNPQNLKEMRNGDDKWKLGHLSPDKDTQKLFTNQVSLLARKKAASLHPSMV
jgi:hypothetical protein